MLIKFGMLIDSVRESEQVYRKDNEVEKSVK